MSGPALGGAALAATTAAVAIFGWQYLEIVRAKRRAVAAEHRFNLLHDLAPVLTTASAASTPGACALILDRFSALVGADTMLCFYVEDDRLILGAKAGAGYVGFLREGEEYAGGAIVQWVVDSTAPAIVGPAPAMLAADSEFTDLESVAGPIAGSRDRVWAIAVPLRRNRGYGLRPQIIGVMYAERQRNHPFTADELGTALTIGQLASDALARATFGDAVRRESERDQLTQLLTPRTFRKRLRDEIEARRSRVGRASHDVGLLFIDTDTFKTWNDTFGHPAGDKLLRTLADAFDETAARGGGFAGRNGGDEFCIGLLDRTKDATIALAESLRERIAGTDFVRLLGVEPPRPLKITVSVGVAHFPVDVLPSEPQPSDKLFETADAMMYSAKRNGRNRVEWRRSAAPARRESGHAENPVTR